MPVRDDFGFIWIWVVKPENQEVKNKMFRLLCHFSITYFNADKALTHNGFKIEALR